MDKMASSPDNNHIYCADNAGFEMEEDVPSKPSDKTSAWTSDKKQSPKVVRKITETASRVKKAYKTHSTLIKHIILGLLAAALLGFLITACVLDLQRALALLIMTCIVVFFLVYGLVKRLLGEQILHFFSPACSFLQRYSKWFKWLVALLAVVGLVAWLGADTARRPSQLISFGGLCTLVTLLFIFSARPRAVSGRALFVGLGLQFILGIFIIRTEPGFQAFNWLGIQIQTFLNYTTAGSRFIFGDQLIDGIFAFQALPIVVFFSSVMSILYYIGAMQWIILKVVPRARGSAWPSAAVVSSTAVGRVPLGVASGPAEPHVAARSPAVPDLMEPQASAGPPAAYSPIENMHSLPQPVCSPGLQIAWLMQITMGTSATETLSVAGNIFVGQTEAPLLIRPYLMDMTKSEIHAVMTGGFATIAGSVLGAYISFGINASNLIAASVMAAPCALALSKLSYPEVEESKFKTEEGVKLDSSGEQNVLEAASNGASASIGLVANIAVNLLAFLAILKFLNAALSWFGGMVDYPQLSFENICSYVFMPLAFIMGADWEDSFLVAELIGVKLFLNEFVAYQNLSQYRTKRLAGVAEFINGKKQWISPRAETISTYALCGFANFSSIGIMLGGLSAMAPDRKSDFAEIIIRALITGFCTSLVNACVAGILYMPREVLDCVSYLNSSDFSGTSTDLQSCCNSLYGSTNVIGNGNFTFEGQWTNVSLTFLQSCCSIYNTSAPCERFF